MGPFVELEWLHSVSPKVEKVIELMVEQCAVGGVLPV